VPPVAHLLDGTKVLPDAPVCLVLLRGRVWKPPERVPRAAANRFELLAAGKDPPPELPRPIQRP